MLLSKTDKSDILLIGDVSKVFSDAGDIDRLDCQIQENYLDGIELAAKNKFAVIGVVMSGQTAGLKAVLTVLRDSNKDSKIILLALMHQEAVAKKLVTGNLNGLSNADDYLISPVTTEAFSKIIKSTQGKIETGSAANDEKIRLLEKLATTDELTGLKNRRYLWEFARQVIELSKKHNNQVTLLIFDIDNFKKYNDLYGHGVGDDILKEAAIVMKKSCRQHDMVARIGGDEFAVVFWQDPCSKNYDSQGERRLAADHPKEAIFIAKRFRKALENTELHLLGNHGKGVLTISGGLASYPGDAGTIEELFGKADRALFDAKKSGKNRIYLVGEQNGDISDIEN